MSTKVQPQTDAMVRILSTSYQLRRAMLDAGKIVEGKKATRAWNALCAFEAKVERKLYSRAR